MDDSTLDDLITSNITISNGGTSTSSSSYTITLDPNLYTGSTTAVYNTGIISGGYSTGIGTITISDGISTTHWGTKPFEDSFPDWEDFQNMCKEYPGLQTAYEHLKVFYKLTVDDWESKKNGGNNI